MENYKIIPEVIYFATHIAIADNRLFDKEWYLLEELMKEYEELKILVNEMNAVEI